jgi:hypothetical protein
MEKRIVRLTESDLEKLVKRIIKEDGEERVTAGDIKQSSVDFKGDVSQLGGQLERNQAQALQNVLKTMSGMNGLQIKGGVLSKFNMFLDAFNKANGTKIQLK